MTSKRKRERENEADRNMKRQRRRKRSRSEPLMNDSDNAEKRQALKRLFGRIVSPGLENIQQPSDDMYDDMNYDQNDYGDENDDPLLDLVPVDMDPGQLGFLVCAQETLRFLYNCRDLAVKNLVLSRLRSRLLRGMDEMAMA